MSMKEVVSDAKHVKEVDVGSCDEEEELEVSGEITTKKKKKKAKKKATVSTAEAPKPHNPKFVQFLSAGLAYKKKGDLLNAIVQYQQAQQLDRSNAVLNRHLAIAFSDLGSQRRAEGRVDEGKPYYYKSLCADSTYGAAWSNLGICYAEEGRHDESEVHYKMAINFDTENADAHNNLGARYTNCGNYESAIHHYKEATRIKPNFVLAFSNLASCYHHMGKIEQARKAGEEAVRLDPRFAEAHNNLGSVYLDQGLTEKAVASFQRCLDLEPNNERFKADGNKLLALNFLPPTYPDEKKSYDEGSEEDTKAVDTLNNLVWEAHKLFGRKFQRKYTPDTSWPNDRNPKRRIKVGILSSDLKTHSVSFFAEAPLRYMDPQKIELFVYMTGPTDAKTELFKKIIKADHWRDADNMSTLGVCELVKRDKIDILVELGGHSAGSRLDVVACKPAPVQVTWIGYANSTGLASIDYRITDELADPRDTRQQFSETLVRMPDPCAFLCYTPNSDVPPVSPLPALKNKYITFGSFNALGKVQPQVVSLWCEVLRAIPNSRMFMKCKHFASDELKARYLKTFADQGIDSSRIQLLAMTPSIADHMALYSKIDIAIDTFPYAGTTTTAEALYMGVPVVCWHRRAAPIHAQNVGTSLLSRIPGMRKFVASSKAHLVQICKDSAANFEYLAKIRADLRTNMKASPLCDGNVFCRELEKVFQDMWAAYCEGRKLT